MNLSKLLPIVVITLTLTCCSIGDFSNFDPGCTFETEMISNADTLTTPCEVTFTILNGYCFLSAYSDDLDFSGTGDTYKIQIDNPGTYTVYYDDNCGTTDCWLMDSYTFTIN
jgi:hypothetical protein